MGTSNISFVNLSCYFYENSYSFRDIWKTRCDLQPWKIFFSQLGSMRTFDIPFVPNFQLYAIFSCNLIRLLLIVEYRHTIHIIIIRIMYPWWCVQIMWHRSGRHALEPNIKKRGYLISRLSPVVGTHFTTKVGTTISLGLPGYPANEKLSSCRQWYLLINSAFNRSYPW